MGGYGVYRDKTLYNLELKDVLRQKLRQKLRQNLYICTGQNHGHFLGKIMDPSYFSLKCL